MHSNTHTHFVGEKFIYCYFCFAFGFGSSGCLSIAVVVMPIPLSLFQRRPEIRDTLCFDGALSLVRQPQSHHRHTKSMERSGREEKKSSESNFTRFTLDVRRFSLSEAKRAATLLCGAHISHSISLSHTLFWIVLRFH